MRFEKPKIASMSGYGNCRTRSGVLRANRDPRRPMMPRKGKPGG